MRNILDMAASNIAPPNGDWKEWLREIRDALGLTQPEMAERVGVALRTYVYWEAGRFSPYHVWHKRIQQLATKTGK